MSVAIWARKTVALGLAATLAGPSLSLLSAQEAQGESQEEKQARRQRQAEKEQQKQQQREQEQAQRQREREERAARQQERAQQEQQQRQSDREERAKQQQDRQAEQQRARQEQREAQEQRQRERASQAEQERAARRTEQAERQAEQARQRQLEEAQRQQMDQAQRDAQRRDRRAEQARVEAEARAAEQARAAAERAQASQQALENQRAVERAQQDAIRRQPVPRSGQRGERVITEERSNELIRENRSRSEQFSRGWTAREQWGAQRVRELERQRRWNSYRYQQRYLDRLRSQWRQDDWWRGYDYGHDPYFWSAPTYRYRYGGSYYQINDYGAELLREAVNRGYEEGFLAGQADRADSWRGDYRDSYVYEDASYGYRGLYVDQRQYAYYFRQGFDRGYADGSNSRYQYGYRDDNNTLKILAGVLAGILVLEAIR